MAGLTRQEWLLVALTILLVGLMVHPYRAQQASRYALTAAVAERGTVVLDAYEGVLGVDRAVRDGRIYSDKAPGQPLLAVPFFLIGKASGVEDASVFRRDGNLGLWWMTFVSSVLPAVALVVMVYRRGKKVAANESAALGAVAAAFLGTLLLPFSALLFGHVLAAALLYGSYLLLVGQRSSGHLATAGLLAGLAVTVEYTALLGVVVLGVFALWQYRRKSVLFAIGGIPAALALAAYNLAAFGHPLRVSYQYSAFTEVTESARGVTSMFSTATLDNTVSLFLDGRGLIAATPVVLIALAGAIWRLRGGFQPDAAMALAMVAVFLLLPLFWGNPWGGGSPGARYMTPAMPFIGVPFIWAFRRWRLITLATIAVSVLTMLTATLTDPLALSRDSRAGIGFWLGALSRGETVDTLPTMVWGNVAWLLHGLAIAGVGLLLVVSSKDEV